MSKETYVSVGVVLTQDNIEQVNDIVVFAHNLGVADIRVIPAAQYDKVLAQGLKIDQSILDAHPILKYRLNNFVNGESVRGLCEHDCSRCHLIFDDSVAAGEWHFPCVIYLREGGNPIGKIGPNMRQERIEWAKNHDTFNDPICKNNCLDVCKNYNDRCDYYKNNKGILL